MPQLTQAGVYKGVIVAGTLGETNKQKCPQFVCTLKVTDCYNSEEGVYESWEEYEEQTITGYLLLAYLDDTGKPAKFSLYDEVMNAIGWDGLTYSSLAAGNWGDKVVAFEVVEEEYNGSPQFKVAHIGDENAQFGGLRPLSTEQITRLDQAFAFAPTKKKTSKPATAPKKKSTPPAAGKKSPTPKKKTTPPKGEAKPVVTCTLDVAWETCIDANEKLDDKKVPDEILEDYWNSHVADIVRDAENITDIEAAQVRDAVLVDLNIPF